MLQGFWKGVLPSIVMVSNPSVNYMLYEYLRARLEDWRRVLSVDDGKFRRTSPAGAICFNPPPIPQNPLTRRTSPAGVLCFHSDVSESYISQFPLNPKP